MHHIIHVGNLWTEKFLIDEFFQSDVVRYYFTTKFVTIKGLKYISVLRIFFEMFNTLSGVQWKTFQLWRKEKQFTR